MAYLTDGIVKAYAGPYKTEDIVPIIPELETAAVQAVFGRLAGQRPVHKWLDYDSTPKQVIRCIAMYYVGRTYQQAYAQDVGHSDYGTVLLAEVDKFIEAVLAGDVWLLDDMENNPTDAPKSPGYYVTEPVFEMKQEF